MPSANLGHTLVIANPAAHSGKGALAIDRVRSFFTSYASITKSFDLERTRAALDGVEMAAHAGGMDTVIVLGGDGIIHEAINGLMAIDERDRPRLGIIPMGSGNDFARTLGITPNNPDMSLAELLRGTTRTIDLGTVTSDLMPGGMTPDAPATYFMETLSFGIDAAIAIDTTARRAAGTKQEGSALFLTSSLKIVAAGSAGYPCTARIDDDEPIDLRTLVFTAQNGPTYGGGFRICPDANPTDGQLDLCYNVKKPAVAHLLFLLALARFGRHVRSRSVKLRKAQSVSIDFMGKEPPCQVDGEQYRGTSFKIGVAPQSLRVIASPLLNW